MAYLGLSGTNLPADFYLNLLVLALRRLLLGTRCVFEVETVASVASCLWSYHVLLIKRWHKSLLLQKYPLGPSTRAGGKKDVLPCQCQQS